MRYIKSFKHMILNISESYLDVVRVDSHGKNIVWEDVSGLYVSVDNITNATYIGLWNSDGKIGSLSLAGERYYNNRIYRKVDYIEIDSRYRGNGYGTLLYKIGLKYLREDIDGIYSYLPDRSNKSQVPRIYKRFNSWVEGDYEYIDRSLKENIKILEDLDGDEEGMVNPFGWSGEVYKWGRYKETGMVDKSVSDQLDSKLNIIKVETENIKKSKSNIKSAKKFFKDKFKEIQKTPKMPVKIGMYIDIKSYLEYWNDYFDMKNRYLHRYFDYIGYVCEYIKVIGINKKTIKIEYITCDNEGNNKEKRVKNVPTYKFQKFYIELVSSEMYKSFQLIKYLKKINENKYNKNIQSELDNILDKINDNGFDSLSLKERDFIKSFNKGTEKKSYQEFIKKEYEDGIFKFKLDNIKDVGNGEREFHGTLTIDDVKFNGYILYKSIGVSSPHFDDENGLTIWDYVEDFEYYLDDFIDYIILDNE